MSRLFQELSPSETSPLYSHLLNEYLYVYEWKCEMLLLLFVLFLDISVFVATTERVKVFQLFAMKYVSMT